MKVTATLLALTALLAARPAPADQPNGTYVFTFSGNNEIIDPFKDFIECDSAFGATLCVTLDMVGDGKGNYTGTSIFEFSGALTGELSGPATGSAACVAADPAKPGTPLCKKASFGINVLGAVNDFPTAAKCKIGGTVDQSGFWDGSGTCNIRIDGPNGRESGRVKGFFTHTVPGGTGTWSLTVDVAPMDAKNLVLTGSTSQGFQYTGKGKYNPKKDESNLPLKGKTGTPSNGSSIMLKKLITSGTKTLGGEASYKVQGNTGKAQVGE